MSPVTTPLSPSLPPRRGRVAASLSGLDGLSVLLWPTLALAALLAFNALFTPGFFDLTWRDGNVYGSIIDVFDRATPVAIIAVGMTLVIATGGIDLSVGAVLAIAGATAATLLANGASVPVAVLAAMASGLACGVVSGTLVAAVGVQPIIATLIVMVAGRGVAQMIGQNVPVSTEFAAFNYLGNGHLFAVPFTITLATAVVVLAIAATRATALGLFLESVGNNPLASRYAGVGVRRTLLVAYVASGLCAAVAGLIVTADIQQADSINAGLYIELDAILAVVVGGTALAGGRYTLLGSALGAVLIQTLDTTVLARDIQKEYALVIKALVVLGVCLLQSPQFRRRLRVRRRSA